MSKRKVVLIVIIFSLLSSMATFGIIYKTDILYRNKVLISEKEYDEYRDIVVKYGQLFKFKEFLEDNYYVPIEEEDLIVGMYKGLFEGTNDPYTKYMTPEEFEEMMLATQGEYQGIGITMAPSEEGYIVIISVVDGAPAERVGLKGGDKIIKVDEVEYSAKTIDNAAANIRGEIGTKVKLTVLFRGREITHPKLGEGVLQRVVQQLSDISKIEQPVKRMGKLMIMVLSPSLAQKKEEHAEVEDQAGSGEAVK